MNKNPVGRPVLTSGANRKTGKSVCLPAYIWDWMEAQELGRSDLVAKALTAQFDIKKPEA